MKNVILYIVIYLNLHKIKTLCITYVKLKEMETQPEEIPTPHVDELNRNLGRYLDQYQKDLEKINYYNKNKYLFKTYIKEKKTNVPPPINYVTISREEFDEGRLSFKKYMDYLENHEINRYDVFFSKNEDSLDNNFEDIKFMDEYPSDNNFEDMKFMNSEEVKDYIYDQSFEESYSRNKIIFEE